MNIRQHAQRAIHRGLSARFDVQDTTPGVMFDDEGEFIPFADLGYNSELGYYRLSAHPTAFSEYDNANPETVHMMVGSEQDDYPMYVWMDADGDLHHLGELYQVADLYEALGHLLYNSRVHPIQISEFDPAWGNNYDIARAVEEAIVYGYGEDPVQMADSIRAAARAGRIKGAVQVDGKWSLPPRTLRGWLVRSREEKRGRPRKNAAPAA